VFKPRSGVGAQVKSPLPKFAIATHFAIDAPNALER
jgi:hypothetical protein